MKRRITVIVCIFVYLLSLTACTDVVKESFEAGYNDGIGIDATVTEKEQTDLDVNEEESNFSDDVLYSKNGTTILLKNELPVVVNFAIGGDKSSSTEILEISLAKATYTGIGFEVVSKKTYEKYKNAPSAFNWKLYDSSDLLIESGPISNSTAALGEKFKEYFSIFEKLGSETYTLVFTDFE